MKKETIAVKLNEKNERICLGSCILEAIGSDRANSQQPLAEQPKPMKVKLVYNQSEQYARVLEKDTAKTHALSKGESIVSENIMFSHAGVCPHFEMTHHDKLLQYANFETNKQVTVAVCGMLTDSDGMILLTKRQSFMRTYPNCWVLPGGLVDPQETFLETVLREIKEEIGVSIVSAGKKAVQEKQEGKKAENMSDTTSKLTLKEQPTAFFLYESVFPTELALGDPQRCSLILFYQIKVAQKFHEILLKQESQEIQHSAWLSPDILRQILRQTQPQHNHLDHHHNSLNHATTINSPPSHIHTALSLENKQLSIELSSLLGIYPNRTGEGIGEAHVQALDYLLNHLQTKNNFNFKQSL